MSILCSQNNKIHKIISTNVQQLHENKIPNTLSHQKKKKYYKEDNPVVVRMALPKTQKVTNVVGVLEERQLRHLFSRNINYYSHCGNALIN